MSTLLQIVFNLFAPILALASSPILDTDFENYLTENMQKRGVVGVAIGVVKDGELIYGKGFGYRDIDKKLPVTSKTLFGIGSTTKAFTATALGLLVERGFVSYDVPVISIIPEFETSNPVTSQTATLRDLLGHMTGVPRHDAAWLWNYKTREEIFSNLFAFPYRNSLREEWEYNNIMYLAAGVVVDKVSGSRWEEFVKNNILTPLEMKSTNFSTTESVKSDDYSFGYEKQADGKLNSFMPNVDLAGPAGSMNSNLEDMSHWVAAQIEFGKWNGKQIFSENVISEVQKPYADIKDEGKTVSQYAQGWVVFDFQGKKMIFHDGSVPGFYTAIGFIPEINTGVIVLQNTQTMNPERVMASAFDRILGLDPVYRLNRADSNEEIPQKTRKHEKLPLPASGYVGVYNHLGYGDLTIEVATKEFEPFQLVIKYKGMLIPIRHDQNNEFECTPVWKRKQDVIIETGLDGKPRSIFVPFENDIAPMEFRRL